MRRQQEKYQRIPNRLSEWVSHGFCIWFVPGPPMSQALGPSTKTSFSTARPCRRESRRIAQKAWSLEPTIDLWDSLVPQDSTVETRKLTWLKKRLAFASQWNMQRSYHHRSHWVRWPDLRDVKPWRSVIQIQPQRLRYTNFTMLKWPVFDDRSIFCFSCPVREVSRLFAEVAEYPTFVLDRHDRSFFGGAIRCSCSSRHRDRNVEYAASSRRWYRFNCW